MRAPVNIHFIVNLFVKVSLCVVFTDDMSFHFWLVFGYATVLCSVFKISELLLEAGRNLS